MNSWNSGQNAYPLFPDQQNSRGAEGVGVQFGGVGARIHGREVVSGSLT